MNAMDVISEKNMCCGVCLAPIEEKEEILTCKDLCIDGTEEHIFHRSCIEQFLMKGVGVYGCPLCRHELKDEYKMIYERESAGEFYEWLDEGTFDEMNSDLSLVQLIVSETESLPRALPHLLAMRRILTNHNSVSCDDITLRYLKKVDEARVATQEEFGTHVDYVTDEEGEMSEDEMFEYRF